jgi:predicted 2-oxoglutarate/Fe(II)-dependent dioxygenase YbiX/peroxiredoxin
MSKSPRLLPGDPAPWFTARSTLSADHHFDAVAGAYVVLTFLRKGSDAKERQIVTAIDQVIQECADTQARWYIVTPDTADEAAGALPVGKRGQHAFFDMTESIRKLYGADAYPGPVSFVLSPRLHVIAVVDHADPAQHGGQISALLRAQVPIEKIAQRFGPPPILIIPDVFEPALCKILIEGYAKHGGEPSGYMRDEGRKSVTNFDDGFKVRRDWHIEDQKLSEAIGARFQRRVVPEIQKAYNFHVTHMERHVVSCYDANEGGHFAPHRDNTSIGGAHRRFACSLNLNDDYEGGYLRFPEFGPQVYRPQAGACVIFGCALLHQATKVTAGKRYAFLPFLHDQAAQKVREANLQRVEIRTKEQAEAAARQAAAAAR